MIVSCGEAEDLRQETPVPTSSKGFNSEDAQVNNDELLSKELQNLINFREGRDLYGSFLTEVQPLWYESKVATLTDKYQYRCVYISGKNGKKTPINLRFYQEDTERFVVQSTKDIIAFGTFEKTKTKPSARHSFQDEKVTAEVFMRQMNSIIMFEHTISPFVANTEEFITTYGSDYPFAQSTNNGLARGYSYCPEVAIID